MGCPALLHAYAYEMLDILTQNRQRSTMSEKKGHLSEAIQSVVEKTLHAATDASPQDEEYWYNLATGEVERGQQSAVTSLWGPFKTYEEAAHAMDRARERNEAWDKGSGLL